MRFKAVTLGFVLASTTLASAALTLGRARGAAWIGQPLELMVPVQVDPGQADGALCAEADVFHGDSRQDAGRVQVVVLPTDQPDTFNLKISSTSLIDEPVVTVYLRAGCSQKSSRKYVLLADFPSDTAAPLSRTAAPAVAQVPLVIPLEAPAATNAAAPNNSSASTTPKAIAKASKPTAPPPKEAQREQTAPKETNGEAIKQTVKETAKEAAPKKESPAKAAAPVDSAKPVAQGKPRLRLDPIETLNERVKTLESTTTGTTTQEDVARDGQKMQLLQNDLKTLLDQAVKNEASLLAMRERLEKAESDRVPVAIVYGLGALVVLCLGALAYLLTRRNRHPGWDQSELHASEATAGNNAMAAGKRVPGSKDVPNEQQGIDVDMVDMDDASFDQLMGQAGAANQKVQAR
ncbi:hypothetical protein DIC66_02280 [Rhodoferax lacus]|uniref:Uncharacterized protein n=1 Tax=Rhodoferax lacus TaxID=2184758 RepID=A0A3E1RH97_9BURK|nr:hypothetical protein [Rhodoferax lacus]RFO98728.1 hypothetical protein DIC66_02280 [Rhodoferax lacus]